MTDVVGLRDYRWSSYWYLHRPGKRPDFLDCGGAIESAGGLSDTRYVRKKYADYLQLLATDERVQKEMAQKENRGRDTSEEQPRKVPRYDGDSLREANELRWELILEECLKTMCRSVESCGNEIKSADWKVMITAALKQKTSATNVWIAESLNMGVPHAVSRYVGIFRHSGREQSAEFQNLVANITE